MENAARPAGFTAGWRALFLGPLIGVLFLICLFPDSRTLSCALCRLPVYLFAGMLLYRAAGQASQAEYFVKRV
jgi:hypothetical protein